MAALSLKSTPPDSIILACCYMGVCRDFCFSLLFGFAVLAYSNRFKAKDVFWEVQFEKLVSVIIPGA